jgi:hypothetical protein
MKKVIFFGAIITIMFVNGISGFSQKQNSENTKQEFINGEVISSDDATINGKLLVSDKPYDEYIVGVFVDPGFVQKPNGEPTLIPKSIVKSEGVVMVKFNSENGIIHKGDWVTSSSSPGVVMKSGKSGMVLGVALEDANESSVLLQIRILIQYIIK